jgi:hypothetical protein
VERPAIPATRIYKFMEIFRDLNSKSIYIKSSSNFNLSRSLNFLYENLIEYTNLECFEFLKSPFLIFKNDGQTLNNLLLFLEQIFKNEKQ